MNSSTWESKDRLKSDVFSRRLTTMATCGRQAASHFRLQSRAAATPKHGHRWWLYAMVECPYMQLLHNF